MCLCVQKLLDRAQEREHCLSETKAGEAAPPQVVELRHTIKVLQQRLEEKEGKGVYAFIIMCIVVFFYRVAFICVKQLAIKQPFFDSTGMGVDAVWGGLCYGVVNLFQCIS